MVSIEQMCRNLLEKAIADKLVDLELLNWTDPDPQCRTASELTGMANILTRFLNQREAEVRRLADELRTGFLNDEVDKIQRQNEALHEVLWEALCWTPGVSTEWRQKARKLLG